MVAEQRPFRVQEFCWCVFLQLFGVLENIAEKVGILQRLVN